MAIRRRKGKSERKDSEVRLRVTEAEKELWTRLAELDRRDLSGWLRNLAAQEADRLAGSK